MELVIKIEIMKKIIKTGLLLIALSTFSISCEKDYKTKIYPDFSLITQEASTLRNTIIGQIPLIKSIIEKSQLKNANIVQLNSNEELYVLLSGLSAQSMCMLESYGIKYSDISQYVDGINDPRIAIIGLVFITCQENNYLQKSSTLKSASIYGLAMDCLSRVFLGVTLSDFAFGSATTFTLSTALGIACRVASRTLGLVGAAIAIADFGDCLAWYNLW